MYCQREFVANADIASTKDYIDDNGSLVNINVPIARSGIYVYKGYEFGLTGDEARQDVVVYRPAETFTQDVLDTFSNIPVTNDHPADSVSPDNFRRVVVGTLGDKVFLSGRGDVTDIIAERFIISDQSAIEEPFYKTLYH